jgi:hypothetical protein
MADNPSAPKKARMFWPWVFDVIWPVQRWGRIVDGFVNAAIYAGVTGLEASIAKYLGQDWRWLRALAVLGVVLLLISSWQQYQTLHPRFNVNILTPRCERQSTKAGVSVVRSDVSVTGAVGEVCVDLVDIRATRNTGGDYLSIAWSDSHDKWQRMPVGVPQQITIGEISPSRPASIRWFTVRTPGPPPSQGTDRMRAVDDDPFIYFRLRVTDRSSPIGLSQTSEMFRLGVKDGEPFCESVQEAMSS